MRRTGRNEGHGKGGDNALRVTSKEPAWCKGVFTYEPGRATHLAFPTYSEGKVGRLCLEITGNHVTAHAPEELAEAVREAVKALGGEGGAGVPEALRALFKSLLSRYHEHLSNLDNETEELIHGMMRGRAKHRPIYRLYDRAARLHRGVHGLIYALQRLDNTYPELRDLTDEAIMLENMLSTTIDRIVQAFNLYYTLVGERTNYVVTKLTVISAIFLPLTLIAGIYGMNFKYMPELSHPLAYPATLTAMAAIALGELIYFKRKGWI